MNLKRLSYFVVLAVVLASCAMSIPQPKPQPKPNPTLIRTGTRPAPTATTGVPYRLGNCGVNDPIFTPPDIADGQLLTRENTDGRLIHTSVRSFSQDGPTVFVNFSGTGPRMEVAGNIEALNPTGWEACRDSFGSEPFGHANASYATVYHDTKIIFVVTDKSGLWVYDSGIHRWLQTTYTPAEPPSQINQVYDVSYYAVAETPDQIVIALGFENVYAYDFYTKWWGIRKDLMDPNLKSPLHAIAFFPDKNQKRGYVIALGGANGWSLMGDNGVIKHFDYPTNVRSMIVDAHWETLWVAGDNESGSSLGKYVIATGDYSYPEIPNSHILQVVYDPMRTLWIATNGGAYRLQEDESWKQYSDQPVNAIGFYEDKALLGSNTGILVKEYLSKSDIATCDLMSDGKLVLCQTQAGDPIFIPKEKFPQPKATLIP